MKHLLVVRFSAFGDVAMTVPVVRAFLEQNPDVSITYVSQSHFVDLFADIDRLLFIPAHLKTKHKGIRGLYRLWREAIAVSGGKIDAYIDLHSVLRTFVFRVFSHMSFIRTHSLRKGRKNRAALIKGEDNKIPLRAIPELYADVFRRDGFSVHLSHNNRGYKKPFSLSVTEKTGFTPHKKSIGIAPFSQYEGKTYPLERTHDIVRTLAEENPSVQIVLMGGKGEESSILEKWASPYPNVICAAGKLSLAEELSLLSQLNVLLSMDSANMHLCSMVGTRVVSVWGATHHFAGFLGYGQNVEDIIEIDNMSCRPCHIFGKKPCRYASYECMHRISEKTIIDKLLSCL